MDTTPITNQFMGMLWFVMPFVILVAVLKTAWFKGIFGEFKVNLGAKFFLDTEKYQLIKNVTLPTESGSTQIDHIIVSKYGVFVVETKNMQGWIFGSLHQKTWTQRIYKYSSKFQNPLHQNYKHVKTLESLLGLDSQQIYSVVVFVGSCVLKTEMPENVTKGNGYIQYIKSKTQQVLTAEEVDKVISTINAGRLIPSLETNLEHIEHVKNLVAEKEAHNSIACPKCSSSMVLRQAKKGQNTGKEFWGCSKFPKCRGIVPIN